MMDSPRDSGTLRKHDSLVVAGVTLSLIRRQLSNSRLTGRRAVLLSAS